MGFDLFGELVRSLDENKCSIGHACLQGSLEVVLSESDRVVGHNVLLDRCGGRAGAILESLDCRDGHFEVGLSEETEVGNELTEMFLGFKGMVHSQAL